MSARPDYEVFDAGDVELQCGTVFRSLKLAYRTYGELNARRDNVIVYPTSFSAQHGDIEWLVREGGALDPRRYFIVIPDLFGNGLSSSPSNSADQFPRGSFPRISYHDAVAVQQRLLQSRYGVSRVALVYGWSMGGMQAYHWAARFPDAVERIAVCCGSARCSPHNQVFLEGVRAALTADPAFQDGYFARPPTRGYRAMGRVYAGWALSHSFYRESLWRDAGYRSLEDFLVRSWDSNFARRDANDLLAQLDTWQHGDISACAQYGGDLDAALAAIRARVLLMPGATDLYFRVEDNRRELARLVNARQPALQPIPSAWGHRAGNPHANPRDRDFLEQQLRDLLASEGGI